MKETISWIDLPYRRVEDYVAECRALNKVHPITEIKVPLLNAWRVGDYYVAQAIDGGPVRMRRIEQEKKNKQQRIDPRPAYSDNRLVSPPIVAKQSLEEVEEQFSKTSAQRIEVSSVVYQYNDTTYIYWTDKKGVVWSVMVYPPLYPNSPQLQYLKEKLVSPIDT